MKNQEIISNFNQYCEEFVAELVNITNDNDIRSYATILTTMNKTNSKKCIEQFIIYVLPEKDKISKCDEKYFLENDYSNHIGNNEKTMMEALKLKSLWKTLDDENKECIFEYLNLLIQISEEYFKNNYMQK